MFVLFSFDLDVSFLSSFGGGNGRFILDNVVCNGNETRLENCSSRGLGVQDCDHSEDAGIICAEGIYVISGRACRNYRRSCLNFCHKTASFVEQAL